MRSISGKITLIQLVDIFRGSASKKSLKYEHLYLYGSGKGLSRGDAERLAQTMVTQRILEEYCEANGLGFVSSYVRSGRDAGLLDSGKRRISMVHHVDGVASDKAARHGASDASAYRPAKKSRDKDTGTHKSDDIKQTLLAFRYMDDEEECVIDDNYDFGDFYHGQAEGGDDDGAEESCVIEDEVEEIPPPMAAAPVDYAEEELRCFDQLLMLRESICMKENITSKFLSNAILGELCRHLPTDVSSLKAIVGSGPLLERHAQAILRITREAAAVR